jgi:hypothetical protein
MSEVKSDSEQKKEDWMNSKWRPMMGWMYMVVCFFDMVIFPILWSLIQTVQHQTLVQWNPLTLQGAGLFHIAMGAVLGIAAMGRTQEKIAGANNGGLPTTQPTTPSLPPATGVANNSTPSPAPSTPGFGSAPAASSSPAPSSFGSAPATPSFGAITTSASGKPGPAQPDHPEI